ncbi:protein DUF3800 [Candidatus Termititenax aidoneus]|uniref:Protein DUF3800 n=1 Tax=Termititenax aidoneus TaxID=2218524 RepID=A0A388TC31_TERA1|nr:protein DUF3800 [Candidatus Termititenax aidoneus]
MEYFVWCDESDSKGKFYSNFYGGVLVKSKDFNYVRSKLMVTKIENNFHGEIKWQKVSVNYLEKYIKAIDVFFDLIKKDFVKVRIMFTHNNVLPKNHSDFYKENEFFLLYYQFIKHAFGLANSNASNQDINLRVYFDRLPNSAEKGNSFKGYIRGLNKNKHFREARIKIKEENIVDVVSHQHDLIQFLDIILGSMAFYLNEKYKELNPLTNQPGRKTLAKEKLCQHILKRINEICPNFSIGTTTSIEQPDSWWQDKYRHWCFEPKINEINFE